MRFSELYQVERTTEDDWFDPFLDNDTPLYPDPFEVYADAAAQWSDAHDYLLDFFDIVLGLVKRSGGDRSTQSWRKAERLLLFPEPAEFCLGLSEGSVRGSGSGSGLQAAMLDGALEAVRRGIEKIEHMELLVLFGEGIGADRVGDIICNVLKGHFIRYTQGVVERHSIPTTAVKVRHAAWQPSHARWRDELLQLPINPHTRGAVLLCPGRFLRDIPVVTPEDFWDWCWSNENERIRGDFNYDIATNVSAREKARLARTNPDLVEAFLRDLESSAPEPYDLKEDPRYYQDWYEDGRAISERSPHKFTPARQEQFSRFISATVVGSFRWAVEDTADWELLWYKRTPRNERAVQHLFRSITTHYCRANNIDISPESNAGRGPVDFKFSRGWTARALVEVKLTNNTKFWKGLQRQLPQYLRAEDVDFGVFLSVGFRDQDFESDRMDAVRKAADSVGRELGCKIEAAFVDARPKLSASRL